MVDSEVAIREFSVYLNSVVKSSMPATSTAEDDYINKHVTFVSDISPENAIIIISIKPLVAVGDRMTMIRAGHRPFSSRDKLLRVTTEGPFAIVDEVEFASPFRFGQDISDKMQDCVWASPDDGQGLHSLSLQADSSEIQLQGVTFRVTRSGNQFVITLSGG